MGSFSNALPTGATGTANSYTSVSGARSTSNVGTSAAKRDVDQSMIVFEPYQTPILTEILTNSARKKPTGNQTFEWIYRTLLPRTDTVTLAGGAANEDNITVGDSTLYQVGTKFVVDATGEVCIVDSIASSQVDVTRVGSGNITAGTTTTVHFLGDSFEQGASSATAKSVRKVFPYNYTERFKVAVNETTSQQATVEHGPDDWNSNKLDRMSEFKKNLEQSFIRGIRANATGYQVGAHTQYFSGGAFDATANYIPAYFAYSGSTPTETFFFDTFLKGWFEKGTNQKRLYAGSTVINAINNYSKTLLQTRVEDKVYGVKIQRVQCPFGELELVWHPMFEGTVFALEGLGLDMGRDYIKMRYLAGNGRSHDLNFYDYPQFEEEDQRKGEWKCEVGWEIQGGEYHSILQPA